VPSTSVSVMGVVSYPRRRGRKSRSGKQQPMDDQFLWTLVIKGKGNLSLLCEGNPPIDHKGGISVCHIVLREQETQLILSACEAAGLSAYMTKMEGQTKEQARERSLLLGQEDRVWPSAACTSCCWFDPLEQGFPCGLVAWSKESIETLRLNGKGYSEAETACPIKEQRSSK